MGRPEKVEGSGQGRGNSGVFIMGLYEIQILDSYDNDTYYDGQAAAVYKQHPPMVNACRKPGEWQTYDIIWEAPKFDKQGKLLKPAYVTVLHNGVVVQNHFELTGGTFCTSKSRTTRPIPTSCRCACSSTATRSASATSGSARSRTSSASRASTRITRADLLAVNRFRRNKHIRNRHQRCSLRARRKQEDR